VIPEDLVFEILDNLYLTSKDLRPDYDGLKRYALVARPWRRPAQRLLFHHIFIRDSINYDRLRSVIDQTTPRGRALADAVHILEYTVMDETTVLRVSRRLSRIFKKSVKATMWGAMQMFPNLYELRVFNEGVSALSTKALAALENTPSIKALRFEMTTSLSLSEPLANCIIPLQLLQISAWSLEFLALDGEWALHPILRTTTINHKFYDIRWGIPFATDFDSTEVTRALQHLTRNSVSTLRALSCPLPENIPSGIFTHLRSLHLTLADSAALASLPPLPNLQELIVGEPFSRLAVEENYYAIPTTLCHLAFAFAAPIPLRKLLFPILRRLQHLEVLSLFYREGPDWKRPFLVNDKTWMELLELRMAFPGLETRLYGTAEATKAGLVRIRRTLCLVGFALTFRLVIQQLDLIKSEVYPRGVRVEAVRVMSEQVKAGRQALAPYII
jgi:hypothetical protein